MKRGVLSVIFSFFIIGISSYKLWSLYQPRVGPVGDGYPDYAYTSMYIGIILGICCLILGIIHIVVEKMKINEQNNKNRRQE